jgi:hypothetical protein
MKRTKSILSTCIVKIYALTHALTVLKYVDFLNLKNAIKKVNSMKRTKSILSTCMVKIYALTHSLTVLKYVDFLSFYYF